MSKIGSQAEQRDIAGDDVTVANDALAVHSNSSSPPSIDVQVQQLQQALTLEREKYQTQLNEKEKYSSRMTELLSALPAGVIVLDTRGKIQECNNAAIDLLGSPLVGELWRDIIEKVFEPNAYAGQEARLTDGRIVSISTCPLGNEPGQIILLMDVTETRYLQQSLAHHQRLSAMGEMSAKLAHQIRTPLASALLYISNLLKGNLADEERNKFVSKALSRLQHLENVVEDMLSFSRVGDLGQTMVALSEIMEETQHAMELALDNAGCRLIIHEKADNIFITANRDALLGVLQNLLTNAMQACSEEGMFWVTTHIVDQYHGIPSVDIEVKDNGPGINHELIDKIFEPFYTTREKGTGLGLAVAKAVVENHGGSIWVESSDTGGTTFVIRLPIAKQLNVNQIPS